MGQRRVKRLQSELEAGHGTQRTREWMRNQIKEINSAIQGTRQYSKSGKRYKSKTQNYIAKQVTRLARAVNDVAPRYTVSGDSFEVTQRELRRASVNLPAAYTKKEVQIFYRATQKIWQQEGVNPNRRNEAILDHYNAIRQQNNLSPLRLDELIDYVLKATEVAQRQQTIDPSDYMTDEETEAFNAAQREDNADADAGSPPGIGQAIVNDIQDALNSLGIMADNIVTSQQVEDFILSTRG